MGKKQSALKQGGGVRETYDEITAYASLAWSTECRVFDSRSWQTKTELGPTRVERINNVVRTQHTTRGYTEISLQPRSQGRHLPKPSE